MKKPKLLAVVSFPFDLDPRLGDPHPPLVNNNYATLSG